MPNWKKVILSGSTASLNSLTVTNGITGSLFGTASYASNGGVTQIVAGTNVSLSPTTGLGAVTINASVTYGQGTNTTASFSNTASWVFNHNLNAQYPIIQVYDTDYNQIAPQYITLTNPNTATITFPGNESGYAVASVGGVGVTAATASYISPTFISASAAASGFGSGGGSSISASYSTSSSYSVSASFAVSASYFGGSVTSASYSTSASFAVSSSYSVSASFAMTSSYIPTLKALSGSAASFAGNPYSASITFLNSYTNNYGVSVVGEDSRAWSISGKSNTGFTINSNSSVGLTGAVYWITTPFNS